MTGTPGKYFSANFSTGFTILGSSGGGEAIGLSFTLGSMVMFGSSMTSASTALVSSAVRPGNMRQLTLASARCGRALSACPASTSVATQVVRSIECSILSLSTMASAALSSGLATSACIAAPVSPPRILPALVK